MNKDGNTMRLSENPESTVSSMVKNEGHTIDPLLTLWPPQVSLSRSCFILTCILDFFYLCMKCGGFVTCQIKITLNCCLSDKRT